MRILHGIVITIYTLIFLILGMFLLAVTLHFKGVIDMRDIELHIKSLPNAYFWVATAAGALLIVLIGWSNVQLAIGKFMREKFIAFNNPDGQITVSLMAIEDFIKRAARQIEEVKELKADAIASRKGVHISCRVALWSDANIPEVTERIQGVVKGRVQDMLGIEEAITVKVHVAKIVQRESHKEPSRKESAETPGFRGIEYRE